jgi:hypothetical protein
MCFYSFLLLPCKQEHHLYNGSYRHQQPNHGVVFLAHLYQYIFSQGGEADGPAPKEINETVVAEFFPGYVDHIGDQGQVLLFGAFHISVFLEIIFINWAQI